MPQKFRNPFSVPPGRRWFYQVPGGRFVESVFGMDDCVIRASAEYRELGQDVPANLEELIQDFMCQSLPAGFCTGKPSISNPTWHSIHNATRKMMDSAVSSGGAGPQLMQVLEKRVRTCQGCKKHRVGICITCNGLLAAFEHFRKGRRSALDRNVRVCAVSHGLLPVVVHLDPKYVTKEGPEDFPCDCWVVTESLNA